MWETITKQKNDVMGKIMEGRKKINGTNEKVQYMYKTTLTFALKLRVKMANYVFGMTNTTFSHDHP